MVDKPEHTAPRETAEARRKRDRRHEELQKRAADLESFLAAVSGAQHTSGGPLVAPGRLVGLVFDGKDTVEEFEITSQKPAAASADTVSPFTDLGAALLWRTAGTKVEYTDLQGDRHRVLIRHVRD